MNTHDDSLQRALEENARLRSEREETLRESTSAEFLGWARYAERIYWVYTLVLVAIGVPAINIFVESRDTKMLITTAVIILVVYETTVLMKLWFHIVKMRMGVLKDVKLLRLEVARVATTVGVDQPDQPPAKYEPVRGAPSWERRLWIVACIVVAFAASTWINNKIKHESGGQIVDDTQVVLAADGSATQIAEIEQSLSGSNQPNSFDYHAPKNHTVRFIDAEGQEMSVEVTLEGTHNHYQVTPTAAAISDGKLHYTRISDTPNAATQKDGVWTHRSDIAYGYHENEFRITVSLPAGAKVISATPDPVVQFKRVGQTALRFQGTRGRNEKFPYSVEYELPEATDGQ